MIPTSAMTPIQLFVHELRSRTQKERLHILRETHFPELTPHVSYVDKIVYLINHFPPAERYYAYTCIFEPAVGLHLAIDCKAVDIFEYFLKLMSSDQLLEAVSAATLNEVSIVQRCVQHDAEGRGSINLFLRTLLLTLENREQYLNLFKQPCFHDDVSISLFVFVMLTNAMIFEHILATLSSEQVYELLSQTITALVAAHWQQNAVFRASFNILLNALAYPFRKRLIFGENEASSSLATLGETLFGYEEMISVAVSPNFAMYFITQKYQNIVDDHDEMLSSVKSYAQFKKNLELIELKQNLEDFHLIDNDNYGEAATALMVTALRNRFLGQSVTAIPFFKEVYTLTNQFYMELMQVIAGEVHFAAMLSLLTGDHANQCAVLSVDFPETFPANLTYRQRIAFFKQSEPTNLRISSIDSLCDVPGTVEALASCVFSNDGRLFIPLKSINRFSIQRHCALYTLLQAQCPALAKKIYRHNEAWMLLGQQIQEILDAGITPENAIKRLVSKLRLGGQAYTGVSEVASESALLAVSEFMLYFDALPENLKVQLLALTTATKEIKLSQVIAALARMSCVETISTHFESILHANEGAACLITPVGLSLDYINGIDKICQRGLPVEQSQQWLHGDMSLELGRQVFDAMNMNDIENLMLILLRMPKILLPYFWASQRILTNADFIEKLLISLKEDLFSKERSEMILSLMADRLFDLNRPDIQKQIQYYFSARILDELNDKKPILPFLSTNHLVRVLLYKQLDPVILKVVIMNPDIFNTLIERLNDKQAFCAVLSEEVSLYGVIMPLALVFAHQWIGHFELLMERLAQDESWQPHHAVIAQWFQPVYLERFTHSVIMQPAFPGNLSIFNSIARRWANPETLAPEPLSPPKYF